MFLYYFYSGKISHVANDRQDTYLLSFKKHTYTYMYVSVSLRFSERCRWGFRFWEMWWCDIGQVVPEALSCFNLQEDMSSWSIWPWRWRRYICLKHLEPLSQELSVTSQKMWILTVHTT